MTINRLVITAVITENRTVREVAATYGVSKSWIYVLLHRYASEGDAAFEARPRRPKNVPNAIPTQTVELIAEEPTPDENTETTQPTETPAEPQNAPQPVELTDKAG